MLGTRYSTVLIAAKSEANYLFILPDAVNFPVIFLCNLFYCILHWEKHKVARTDQHIYHCNSLKRHISCSNNTSDT